MGTAPNLKREPLDRDYLLRYLSSSCSDLKSNIIASVVLIRIKVSALDKVMALDLKLNIALGVILPSTEIIDHPSACHLVPK